MLYTQILKDRKVFLKLYKKGRFAVCPEVTAYFLPNRLEQNRFGITCGKKIGNAVARNRAKRIIRSAYRLNEQLIPKGFDIVFVAREGIIGSKSCDIERFIKEKLVGSMNNRVKKDGQKN